MELCFSTLGCTEKSLDEILKLCPEYGFHSLEIRGMSNEMNNEKIPEFCNERIEKTVSDLKNADVSPLIIGTSCSFHSADNRENALSEGKAAVIIAEKLGAKGIRVFGNDLGSEPEKSTLNVINGLKELCSYAEKHKIDVLLEVHGDFNTTDALMPIIEALKSRNNFGLIWDICHTHGNYGNNWHEFYEPMRPYIRHVHIKDVKNGKLVLPGEGEIPINNIVSKMLADGYPGAFSLEWEKKWHPELEEFETALKYFYEVMKK